MEGLTLDSIEGRPPSNESGISDITMTEGPEVM